MEIDEFTKKYTNENKKDSNSDKLYERFSKIIKLIESGSWAKAKH